MEIISLPTMGTRIMPIIVGEHTLFNLLIFRAKILNAKLRHLLIEIVCQSASRSSIQRYELESQRATPGHYHKPIAFLGFQAANWFQLTF